MQKVKTQNSYKCVSCDERSIYEHVNTVQSRPCVSIHAHGPQWLVLRGAWRLTVLFFPEVSLALTGTDVAESEWKKWVVRIPTVMMRVEASKILKSEGSLPCNGTP